MTEEEAPSGYAPRWPNDTRAAPPWTGDEREILTGFLDWHRETFALKISGVDPALLSEPGVPPSTLTLHGLLRHLADVERWWFRMQFAREDVTTRYFDDDDLDGDFDNLDGDVAEVLAAWRDECGRSRAIAAAASLDDTGVRERDGEPFSLRWLLVHMIAEYARHNGHADLLRERADGATGA